MYEDSEDILIKFCTNKCTVEERTEILRRLKADETYRKEYARLMDVLFLVRQAKLTDTQQYSDAIDKIFNRTVDQKSWKSLKFSRFYKYAVVVLLFMTLGIVFVYNRNNGPDKREFAQCVVPDGKCDRVVLPDSSVIWINGGTTVRYAKDFGVHERWVELDGEAYFEVTHKSDMPFVVDMKDFQIEVFGTKFNVSSYNEDEWAEAVLDEGHIGVRLKSSGHSFIDLQTREKVIFDRKEQKLTKEMTTDTRSWKDGFLVFNKDNFDVVARKMEHRYGVKIKVEKIGNNNYLYTGIFAAESLKDILDAIDFLTPIEYTLNVGEVLISFK